MKVLLKRFTKTIGIVYYSRYVRVFVNGFLLASLLYFYIEDAYEKSLFEVIAVIAKKGAINHKNKEEALLQNCVHLTYYLGKSRSDVFHNCEIHSLKSSFIHPVTYDLMTVNGACGSYSYILSRLLNELKVTNRIVQMKVNGKYGGHILVEAKTSNGWAVLDASYDLFFKKADGNLASFEDVHNNWNFYKTQVPVNYDYRYKYDGVRYTNWSKIPVLMPLFNNIISFCFGKQAASDFSFRTYFLRKFHILFDATLIFYCILGFITIRKYALKNRRKIRLFFPILFATSRPLYIITTDTKRNCA